jgi:hypothetical protein
MIAESIDTATWLFMVDDVGTVRGMCQPSMAAVESKQSGVAFESKQSMANLFSSAAMHAAFSFFVHFPLLARPWCLPDG